MPITYILCAAGDGTRFRSVFGNIPKAAIRMHGRTLLEWSILSLPLMAEDRLVIVSQSKHRLREKLLGRITALNPFSDIKWHEIDGLTRGQLETALLAHPYALPRSPVAIYNCDTYFQSKDLLRLMEDPNIDGIVPCAQAEGDAWSFCAVRADNTIYDIREKERISSWATVGFYYFRDGDVFFQKGEADIQNHAPGECYVAPLYQQYISEGKKIIMDPVHLFKPMGTPEQVEIFWETSMMRLKNENFAPVLVMDLDGTITHDDPKIPYADKEPNIEIIEKMHQFSDAGWEIIIHTARRMQSFGNDEAKVIANIALITQDWLQRHNVPHDGLRFGKPYARNGYYVDDKALSLQEFLTLDP